MYIDAVEPSRVLGSASAEPASALRRMCWCAPSAEVAGLRSSVPSQPGYIMILSTSEMRETFAVQIISDGRPTAQFDVKPEPYKYVDIYFRRPGA